MLIKPGIGYGAIKFGATFENIENQFGSPDKEYRIDSGARRLCYYKHRLALGLSIEQPERLTWLEVRNTESELCGLSIFEISIGGVIEQISDYLDERPAIEDYGSFESYYFESKCLEIQSELGLVSSVNFGVTFGKCSDYSWPW